MILLIVEMEQIPMLEITIELDGDGGDDTIESGDGGGQNVGDNYGGSGDGGDDTIDSGGGDDFNVGDNIEGNGNGGDDTIDSGGGDDQNIGDNFFATSGDEDTSGGDDTINKLAMEMISMLEIMP